VGDLRSQGKQEPLKGGKGGALRKLARGTREAQVAASSCRKGKVHRGDIPSSGWSISENFEVERRKNDRKSADQKRRWESGGEGKNMPYARRKKERAGFSLRDRGIREDRGEDC